LGFLIWVRCIGFILGNPECSTKSPPWGELFVVGLNRSTLASTRTI
jgi:hypothetical protein